jgi:SNF2 family DNA or RNA helicase
MEQIIQMVHFLMTPRQHKHDKINRKELTRILRIIFRQTMHRDVALETNIPTPTLTTQVLDQSALEKLVYTNVAGDRDKMRRVCNQVLVTEQHFEILGKRAQSVEDIQHDMHQYYQDKIENTLSTDCTKLYQNRIHLFNTLNERINATDVCPVCLEDFQKRPKTVVSCGHFFCTSCMCQLLSKGVSHRKCPICRFIISRIPGMNQWIHPVRDGTSDRELVHTWGTKMAHLVMYLEDILKKNTESRILVYSTWNAVMRVIASVLEVVDISHVVMDGSEFVKTCRLERFRLDTSIRVVLLSGQYSSLNLTDVTHMIFLDTHQDEEQENKIISRVVRIGQRNSVHVHRFVMRDTLEHDYYLRNQPTLVT